MIFKESVCGLKWNDHLLSTGTDDDNIIIWDDRKTFNPLYKFSDHSSSVKALSWNPKNNNILASGGGKNDKRIIIWDTSKGIKITEFLTKSQISGIEWNNEGNILVVSHGYNYYNISLYEFKNDNLYFINTNECHNKRILTLSKSHINDYFLTLSYDESIKIWELKNDVVKNKDLNNITIR